MRLLTSRGAAGQFGRDARVWHEGRRVRTAEPDEWRKVSHVRLFALLSDQLLKHLGRMAAAWVASGIWPSVEEEVVVVLLPKAAGGSGPLPCIVRS